MTNKIFFVCEKKNCGYHSIENSFCLYFKFTGKPLTINKDGVCINRRSLT